MKKIIFITLLLVGLNGFGQGYIKHNSSYTNTYSQGDLVVSGTLNPDITGIYTNAGTLNGSNQWAKGNFRIQWNLGAASWFIANLDATVLWTPTVPGDSLLNDYPASLSCTGTATVVSQDIIATNLISIINAENFILYSK